MTDYKELDFYFGDSPTIPLSYLSCDNLELRTKAIHDLWGICEHQETIDSYAYIVIPSLIKRLEIETDIDVLKSLIILLDIIGSGDDWEKEKKLIKYRDKDRESKSKDDLDYLPKIVLYDRNTEEFNKGIETYLRLLKHDSPEVRLEIVYCLSCCLLNTQYISDKLYEHFEQESDEEVLAAIPLYLVFINNLEFIDSQRLENILDTEITDYLKLSVSIALAFMDREKLSERAINTLSKLFAKSNLISRLSLNHEEFMCFAHWYSIIDFLKYLSEECLLKFLPTIIDYIDNEQYRRITVEHGKFVLGYQELFDNIFYNSSIAEGTIIEQLPKSQIYFLKEILKRNKINKKDFSIYDMLKVPYEQLQAILTKKNLLDFINGKPIKYEYSNLLDYIPF